MAQSSATGASAGGPKQTVLYALHQELGGKIVPFAGYALGYRAVQAYLARTGRSAAEATFLPAAEILAESGYFAE